MFSTRAMLGDPVTEQFQTPPPPQKGTADPRSSPTPFHFLHHPPPAAASHRSRLCACGFDRSGHFMSTGVPQHVAFRVWFLSLAVVRVRASRLLGAEDRRVVGTHRVCGPRRQPVDIGLAPCTSPASRCRLESGAGAHGSLAVFVWKAGSRSISPSTCAWLSSSLSLLIHAMGIKASALLTQPCGLLWATPPSSVSVSRSPAADVKWWFFHSSFFL